MCIRDRLGIESIPSESECYPAKLAHGHVTWLIRQGLEYIFYPCIPYERVEVPDAGNHYNCPIVTSYGENIKNNIEELRDDKIKYQNPFISLESEEILTKRLVDFFRKENGIPAAEIKAAAPVSYTHLITVKTIAIVPHVLYCTPSSLSYWLAQLSPSIFQKLYAFIDAYSYDFKVPVY